MVCYVAVMPDRVDALLESWSGVRPDLDTSSTAVLGRVSRLLAYTEPELQTALAERGLRQVTFDVLAALVRAPEHTLTQRGLAASLLRTAGTVSVRLDRLERAGLIARQADPDDRRGVLVTLTSEGRRRFDDAASHYLARGRSLLDGLDAAEQEQLAQLLRRLLEPLEAHEDEATGPDRPAPRLGIIVAPSRVAQKLRRSVGLPERPGVLVRAVRDGSAAARAGLAQGDLVVGVGEDHVERIADLQGALAQGGEVELRLVRGVEERVVAVTLDVEA